MVKKLILYRDQIGDSGNNCWESEVIGVDGEVILVEAESPEEETSGRGTMVIEDLINEPGEW